MGCFCEDGNDRSRSIKEGNFLTGCVTVSYSGKTLNHVFSYFMLYELNSKRVYSVFTVLFYVLTQDIS
jgi:hypothetical protein